MKNFCFSIIISALACCNAAEMEHFVLSDGRVFVGTYDQQSRRLHVAALSIAVKVDPEQIQERRPATDAELPKAQTTRDLPSIEREGRQPPPPVGNPGDDLMAEQQRRNESEAKARADEERRLNEAKQAEKKAQDVVDKQRKELADTNKYGFTSDQPKPSLGASIVSMLPPEFQGAYAPAGDGPFILGSASFSMGDVKPLKYGDDKRGLVSCQHPLGSGYAWPNWQAGQWRVVIALQDGRKALFLTSTPEGRMRLSAIKPAP